MQYIGRFAQSLGSSGNHFTECPVIFSVLYWLVVHSGSRGLGAKVYDVIAQACRAVNDGFEVATGELAKFYTVAYDALNKFAKMNRVICAIAVLKELNYVYSVSTLKSVMAQSHLFAPAIEKCGADSTGNAMLALISGLTHNGLKAYVNDVSKEVLFVLSKGHGHENVRQRPLSLSGQ